MKRKSGKLTTLLLVLVFFAGLSLLLYPTFSDYWNSFHQTRAITSYSDQVAVMDRQEYDSIWQKARAYNASLLNRLNGYSLTEELKAEYEEQLNITGTGVMGYIKIPSIDVSLPIYHGTSDSVLQVAVGHLEWTSLPVGGKGSHCVLSGHRGLPSARLFTDLDKLTKGDQFTLHILDEVLTYEVDRIMIVEPDETEELQIRKGRDLCTLVTCTPYGINTHRLLVRGHRVDTVKEAKAVHVTADAIQIEELVVATALAVPLLLLMLVVVLITPKRKKKHDSN